MGLMWGPAAASICTTKQEARLLTCLSKLIFFFFIEAQPSHISRTVMCGVSASVGMHDVMHVLLLVNNNYYYCVINYACVIMNPTGRTTTSGRHPIPSRISSCSRLRG